MNSECKRIETCFVDCMKRISQPKLKGPLSKMAIVLRYGAVFCGVFHTRDSCNVHWAYSLARLRLSYENWCEYKQFRESFDHPKALGDGIHFLEQDSVVWQAASSLSSARYLSVAKIKLLCLCLCTFSLLCRLPLFLLHHLCDNRLWCWLQV